MGFAPLNPSYDPTPDGSDAGSLSFAGRYNINGPQNAKIQNAKSMTDDRTRKDAHALGC
jgi:hypothetical protein